MWVLFCQREFKPSGYYAECIDLVRKLVLSGMVSLLSPGTVVQSFVTAVFSLLFMVIHARICKSTSCPLRSIQNPQLHHVSLHRAHKNDSIHTLRCDSRC